VAEAWPCGRGRSQAIIGLLEQYMSAKATPRVTIRDGDPLQIGPETVSFGRNAITRTGSPFRVQHRFFVNDPWELIAEAIHRDLPPGRTRDVAHSFRRQAEDYFRAATIGRELAVRPVLFYYAFLNLSKAYAVARGNAQIAGKIGHGVSSVAKPKAVAGSLIKFEKPSAKKPGAFQALLQQFNGNSVVLNADLRLGYLLPQILPGHRLWCYATNRSERFLSVEKFDIRHDPVNKAVWLNLYLARNDLDRLGMSKSNALSQADFAEDFEVADEVSSPDFVCFQQRNPESYNADPADALAQIILKT
jgi:hypothetical protein